MNTLYFKYVPLPRKAQCLLYIRPGLSFKNLEYIPPPEYVCFFYGFQNERGLFPLEHFRRVRSIAKNYCYFRHVFLSVFLPIHMENFSSHWTDFHEILYSSMLRKYVEECKFRYNLTRITCTLHEDPCTSVICRSILLRMRNALDRNFRENQTTFCVP
jgi:hypothetical protein